MSEVQGDPAACLRSPQPLAATVYALVAALAAAATAAGAASSPSFSAAAIAARRHRSRPLLPFPSGCHADCAAPTTVAAPARVAAGRASMVPCSLTVCVRSAGSCLLCFVSDVFSLCDRIIPGYSNVGWALECVHVDIILL